MLYAATEKQGQISMYLVRVVIQRKTNRDLFTFLHCELCFWFSSPLGTTRLTQPDWLVADGGTRQTGLGQRAKTRAETRGVANVPPNHRRGAFKLTGRERSGAKTPLTHTSPHRRAQHEHPAHSHGHNHRASPKQNPIRNRTPTILCEERNTLRDARVREKQGDTDQPGTASQATLFTRAGSECELAALAPSLLLLRGGGGGGGGGDGGSAMAYLCSRRTDTADDVQQLDSLFLDVFLRVCPRQVATD